MRLVWVLLISIPLLATAKLCPDKKSRCPDGSTCCPIGDSEYGCCPVENAVCCSDHEHCCPADTQCDLEHERCIQGSRHFPLHRKRPAEDVFVSNAYDDSDEGTVESVVEIDVHERLALKSRKQKKLPPLPSREESPLWPLPRDEELPALPADRDELPPLPSKPEDDSVGDVTCSDGKSKCPDLTTCCPLGEGVYGCCPAEGAVCCQDHLHCCPHGTQCDTEHGRCIDGVGFSQFWMSKLPSTRAIEKPVESRKRESVGDITCSDGKSKCPDHTTCCPITEGVYGCCPSENAVCCDDHIHCCPEGTQCDTAQGTCLGAGGFSQPWYRKFASTKAVKKPAIATSKSRLQCENGDRCKSGETCCIDAGNEGFCCPFKDGSCCANGQYCCPSGFRCSSFEGRCVAEKDRVYVSTVRTETTPAKADNDEDQESESAESDITRCPDGSHCGPLNTCCPIRDSVTEEVVSYECCPLSNAVCCDASCCPRGYHCLSGGRCEKKAMANRFTDYFL